MDKQRAHINNWAVVPNMEADVKFLVGNVTSHPNQDQFSPENFQRTSNLVYIDLDRGEAETRNTIYTLGDAMPTQADQLF